MGGESTLDCKAATSPIPPPCFPLILNGPLCSSTLPWRLNESNHWRSDARLCDRQRRISKTPVSANSVSHFRFELKDKSALPALYGPTPRFRAARKRLSLEIDFS